MHLLKKLQICSYDGLEMMERCVKGECLCFSIFSSILNLSTNFFFCSLSSVMSSPSLSSPSLLKDWLGLTFKGVEKVLEIIEAIEEDQQGEKTK